MKYYVKVRVNDVDRTIEWRKVEAEDLEQAVKVVERMPDVVAVWAQVRTPVSTTG